MATVTGLTAARMLEIEAASVVSGTVNGSGHLILTTKGGTTIDAGSALVAIPQNNTVQYIDPVSYNNSTPTASYPDGESYMWMDNAETSADWTSFSGKWGSLRTVKYTNADAFQVWTRLHGSTSTPEMWIRSGNSTDWSSWKKVALDENAIHILATNALLETNTSAAYSTSVTLMNAASGSGFSLNGGLGTVVTQKISEDRIVQAFYSSAGGTSAPEMWIRSSHTSTGGGGWTSWQRVVVSVNLNPASYSQTSLLSTYPKGQSRLYFSPAPASWDFSGQWAEVITWREGDDFGKQIYTQHTSGSTSKPDVWTRTANAANGWTRWTKTSWGIIAVKDQAISSIGAGTNTYTINLPSGKAMPDTNYVINYTVTDANTATFGSTVFSNAGARPSTSTSFLVRVTSSAGSAQAGYISYVLTPVQG